MTLALYLSKNKTKKCGNPEGPDLKQLQWWYFNVNMSVRTKFILKPLLGRRNDIQLKWTVFFLLVYQQRSQQINRNILRKVITLWIKVKYLSLGGGSWFSQRKTLWRNIVEIVASLVIFVYPRFY